MHVSGILYIRYVVADPIPNDIWFVTFILVKLEVRTSKQYELETG
jgi:hypothetical protein